MPRLFDDFLKSQDTLRVYHGNKLFFTSSKGRLAPLLEYIEAFVPYYKSVTVFDRIVGNAAALLLKEAFCTRVYSPLGSELAIKTLIRYGIQYDFVEVVPHIRNSSGEDICPMEKLSLNKSPRVFYEAIKGIRHPWSKTPILPGEWWLRYQNNGGRSPAIQNW